MLIDFGDVQMRDGLRGRIRGRGRGRRRVGGVDLVEGFKGEEGAQGGLGNGGVGIGVEEAGQRRG